VRAGFVFEDVGFRYPGSDRWAVRHVDFTIAPGERIALVGENGAGKTTITKLLARLYDPNEGRILLDGRDLREYDLTSVREAIGVIFQDFVRYDMAFDENIAVGEIAEAREYLAAVGGAPPTAGPDGAPGANGAGDATPPPRAIAAAAEQSLAASLLPRLPAGYRQMLGRRFEGGVDLSGGEWQKVALARAYMREAALLILDEPHRGARRARRVRRLRALQRADGGADGGGDLAPLLDRPDGRPHPRPGGRRGRRGGDARGAAGARRRVRGAVPDAGRGLPVRCARSSRRRWQPSFSVPRSP
jgi:ABC-type multidrug transport system fused ATPase/permease subunit